MTLKTKISIFSLIMFISLVSVGFASWTIATPEQSQTSSPSVITSESSIDSSKYVTTVETTNFTYYSNGFTTDGGDIVDNGTLTIKLNVSTNCLKFKFKLKFSDAINKDINDKNIFTSITYKVKSESSEIALAEGSVTEFEFEFDWSKLSSNNIIISFTFNKDHNDFYEDVYKPILKENINIFSYNITVTDVIQVDE